MFMDQVEKRRQSTKSISHKKISRKLGMQAHDTKAVSLEPPPLSKCVSFLPHLVLNLRKENILNQFFVLDRQFRRDCLASIPVIIYLPIFCVFTYNIYIMYVHL